jgi:SAM-dependent methyltransferase
LRCDDHPVRDIISANILWIEVMRFKRNRTADDANQQYFRNAYSTGLHGWANEEPSPYALEFLKRLRLSVPGGKLLDVGCGQGRHAIAAAKLGFKVTAIDYEPLALKRARRWADEKGVEGIVFKTADVFNLPFGDEQFDIVLDYGCLHHQKKSSHPTYVKSILRVLKDGGFFILSVFGPDFHLFKGSHRKWHIAMGAYRRYFTPRDIRELFARRFEILELIEEHGDGRDFWHALMRRHG